MATAAHWERDSTRPIIIIIIIIQLRECTRYGPARPVNIISENRRVFDDSAMQNDNDQYFVSIDIMLIRPHSSTFPDCVDRLYMKL